MGAPAPPPPGAAPSAAAPTPAKAPAPPTLRAAAPAGPAPTVKPAAKPATATATATATAAATPRPPVASRPAAPVPTAGKPAAIPAPAAVPPKPAALDRASLEALQAKLAGADHFAVLGVKQDAPGGQIKVAYFQLAKTYHPDAVPADASPDVKKLCADVFAKVSEAWSVLGDEVPRAAYIEKLKGGGTAEVDVMNIFEAENVFQAATMLVKARKYDDAAPEVRRGDEAQPRRAGVRDVEGLVRFPPRRRQEEGDRGAPAPPSRRASRRTRAALRGTCSSARWPSSRATSPSPRST